MEIKKENWWDEEAERLDKMGDLVRKKRYTIKVGPEESPELNEDGSENPIKKIVKALKKKKKVVTN